MLYLSWKFGMLVLGRGLGNRQYSPCEGCHECAALLLEEIASLLCHPLFLNPLTPKSDQILISPYNYIIPESNIKVTGIKEMIAYL